MDTEASQSEIFIQSRENLEKNEKDDDEYSEEKPDLRGDYGNAALLVLLYSFQGLLLGLCAAVPILLQNRGASYKEQALFSLVYYPFSSNF